MPASQDHVTASTPMGATLVGDGATFRVWAPGADRVAVVLDGAGAGARADPPPEQDLLKDPATGHWTGYLPGVADGTLYRYLVAGPGGSGLKRDPWARELELQGYPDCDCIVRSPGSYPWHDAGFRPPAFDELVVYQLHVGRYYARDAHGRDRRPYRVARFLDVLGRVEYLADLGVTAVQPLPFVEFQGEWSLGYNGTDLFSPEMDYCVPPPELPPYLDKVNALLAAKGAAPLRAEQLAGQVNQLKAFVDVCHLYGLAVIPDVVYNHAGGGFDPQSIDYFDFPANPDRSNSLYFSGDEWAGGRVFAFRRPQVASFLIENAKFFLSEYHVDGFRFDEVTVIDSFGGWFFAQALTGTLRYLHPRAALIAEYWGAQRWRAVAPPPDGMGFDLGYADGLRDAVRSVLAQAAGGGSATVDIGRLRDGLVRPWNVPAAWQAYNCLENHDLVLDAPGHGTPRIARLAGGNDARSWYARSRSRVATGLLLTAPGVPMLFMGEEFLEDKPWSDDPGRADTLIWWDGLDGQDRHMADFQRFTRDLVWLRRRQPALRAGPVVVLPPDPANRVLAFHRWVPGVGRDVLVVASLSEATLTGYSLGFPAAGRWHEVHNSDYYDLCPNPWVQGNAGGVTAGGPPMHGMPTSARLTIPANTLLVFARDPGD
ncbi:MAG: alpha amylase C-terminal domain-containing protein [Mycobacteriales bacterium]